MTLTCYTVGWFQSINSNYIAQFMYILYSGHCKYNLGFLCYLQCTETIANARYD